MTEVQRREYRAVVLGALLHDIGKYLQRGNFAGAIKGQHPEVGANFIGAWRDCFARCVDADLLHTLVQRHHESASFRETLRVGGIADPHIRALARLVSRADNLASSERGERAGGYQDFRTTALAPVFQRVSLLQADTPPTTHLPHAEVRDLDGEPPLFPRPGRQATSEEVTEHIRTFGATFAALKDRLNWEDFECVYSHLYALLQRFTSCIASDTQSDPPDISLFDHLRVTSAIAACLYQFHAGAGTVNDEAVQAPSGPRCALAVGDLSGIQDYLFDIATVGAGGVARRLRARSFFLQLLADVAALKILRTFALPLSNVLMASGGKFYILLPNLPDTDSRLDLLQAECDAWLLDRFHGALALNLSWTPVGDDEFGTGVAGGSFSAALARLHGRLAQRKGRRLERVLAPDGRWAEFAFLRAAFPAETVVCRVCSRFPAEHSSEPEGDRDICLKCYQDVRLGRLLPVSQYVGFCLRPNGPGTACFDWTFIAVRETTELPRDCAFVTRLNHADLIPLADVAASYRFVANHVPHEDNGIPWTFSDIAACRRLAENEPGQGLLAVIKADVDYLGQVFQAGLRRDQPPGYDTPSRIASLSRQLDLFFSGWVQWLLQTEFPNVYAVYSGGDDLLLIGPRGQALPLVKRLREAFFRYTDNPELTLSAGVAVVKPRLPLARTVTFAEDALEQAKRAGRDRLCLLNQVVSWPDLPLIERAVALLEAARPPVAFLHQLVSFAGLWRQWRAGHDPRFLRFQPLLAYSISRNVSQGSELYSWASRLVGFPLNDPQRDEAKVMDYLGVIAKWVILGRRGEQT